MSLSELYTQRFKSKNRDHFAAIVRLALADGKITKEEQAFINRTAINLEIDEDEVKHIIENISFKESKNINYFDAAKVGNLIIEKFQNEEFDFCTIFFNKFKNVISQIPQAQQIIPLENENKDKDEKLESNYEFEPDEDEILSNLLPKNISTQIFKAMLENSASEQGSRMTAMDNATRNAGDLVDKLTIQYNRSRQAAITKELIEIISGAESL